MFKVKKPSLITVDKLYKLAKTFDQKLKKTDLDKKCIAWSKDLKEVGEQFEQLHKKILSKETLEAAELKKKFADLSKKTAQIQKALKRSLKSQAKERSKIQEKLLSKLTQVTHPDKLLFDATQVFCNNINQKMSELKTLLEQTAGLLETQLKTGQALELLVVKLTLPDSLETCNLESKKLNERMEMLCQTSAAIPSQFPSNPKDPLTQQIKTVVFSLKANYLRGGQLLEQMTSNLNKAFPDNDQKESRNDQKELPKENQMENPKEPPKENPKEVTLTSSLTTAQANNASIITIEPTVKMEAKAA